MYTSLCSTHPFSLRLSSPRTQICSSWQERELERVGVQREHAVLILDAPVNVPRGADAAVVDLLRVEVHLDVLGSWQRAPGAVAVADVGDPGARAVTIEGDTDGLEGEPVATAGVRAREHSDEAKLNVVDGEVGGGAGGEAEGEARGVEVGGAVDGVVVREGRLAVVGGGVEEVAEERRNARKGGGAGGRTALAAAGERGEDEVGRAEAEEDAVEVLVPKHSDRWRLTLLLWRRHGEA
ncbi:hypothetical protein QOZ80_6AG0522310 [Eleusine coracana subsp. coracana]|nr:hypothetical protein QOZ80_6AG0522310 [Eleusine coracana subsp. coracana]